MIFSNLNDKDEHKKMQLVDMRDLTSKPEGAPSVLIISEIEMSRFPLFLIFLLGATLVCTKQLLITTTR